MRLLILFLILLIAALLSQGSNKIVNLSNKSFYHALFFLYFGIISSVTYFLSVKELQSFVSTLILIGFVFTIFYILLGVWKKNHDN